MKKKFWIIIVIITIILLLALFLVILPGIGVRGFEPLRYFWDDLFSI